MNPLAALHERGQSVWLDYIRRNLLESGELERFVADGLRGVTSNPTIFEKAIAGSADYDETIRGLLEDDPQADPERLYEHLTVEDIQRAADVLRALYDQTAGTDGFVSLEVSPHLARDPEGTIAEARRLWRLVDRPNLMVKVPATAECVPAIETLIGDGININVTLIFSLAHYEAIAQAYLRGLGRAENPGRVASVASFFVSRVDTAVDRELEQSGTPEALALRGKIAIANSKLAYRRFGEIVQGSVFSALQARGARPQRLLWASTGTKNAEYSDVLYIEELVGSDTVNTVPPDTLDAFRDHGQVRGATLAEDVAAAAAAVASLNELGVDLDAITAQLQVAGVASFADSYDQLLDALEDKAAAIRSGPAERQSLHLNGYQAAVRARLDAWRESRFARRLWAKDPTLWFPDPREEITDRLGWLGLPEIMRERLDELARFANEAKDAGTRHVVLLGMGGSSLAPEVFQSTFGNAAGYPELIVLDSTHPAAVQAVDARIDPQATVFVVSSKSGTTLETLSFFRHFWSRVANVTSTPGAQFVAITDPGTPLAKLARERDFRRMFEAPADVGGRYSALTLFGLVPAALIGVDVARLLDRAWTMAEASAFCVPAPENPALELGAALGELALAGRDKATFLVSPGLRAFPLWVEQLIAESTGKDGKGIVPVADEPAGTPEVYGTDRFFIYLYLEGDETADGAQRQRLDALEAAGHPVARIRLSEPADIGQEIFRQEVAVAAAGAVLGVHPFDQPDVQLAKELARQAMDGQGGADGDSAETLSTSDATTLHRAANAWLGQVRSGDYLSIQAYLPPDEDTTAALQAMRLGLRDRLRLATTLGYGPRFLHSTGQLHKGGPNSGLFLQIVDEPVEDLAVAETDYSFGQLISAQSQGDYQALQQRDRRVLRVNLGSDVTAGLAVLGEALHG